MDEALVNKRCEDRYLGRWQLLTIKNNKFMCLVKNKKYHPFNRPLIAKEDIVCYKKLGQDGENIYTTPCTDTQVPIECIQNKIPFKAQILSKFKFIWKHVFGFGRFVEDGFIHSFQEDDGYSNYAVFKCIIPKGTKYFVGYDGVYASEQIVFIEQLK